MSLLEQADRGRSGVGNALPARHWSHVLEGHTVLAASGPECMNPSVFDTSHSANIARLNDQVEDWLRDVLDEFSDFVRHTRSFHDQRPFVRVDRGMTVRG